MACSDFRNEPFWFLVPPQYKTDKPENPKFSNREDSICLMLFLKPFKNHINRLSQRMVFFGHNATCVMRIQLNINCIIYI